jgi:hypothetical protein
MKTALFPATCNPPTFGTILALKYIEDKYDMITVVVEDKPLLLSTIQVMGMLTTVLCRNSMKYIIVANKCDFEEESLLPETLPKYDDIVTDNPKIYSNLISKGYRRIRLIPKPLGYEDMFHRIAYIRSITYERILKSLNISYAPEQYIKNVMK